ncbi:cellulase family glycosylhydrolase [Chitinispirillales bacterium ANBcel5]|uniref:cellulase family glycosylhydrolase n=1 Tax=Cellulosispirillum alkaliphilum TaxID=3039283 RepID=UPI002A53B442|nr:cellulase family glycosylhydrolase [Chitinispirillales bacterium ANBcel5]
MKLSRMIKFFTILAVLVFSSNAATPVARHGRLRVDGNRIVNEHYNIPVQLRGMSLYWSVWGGEHFYNEDVVNTLVDDWKVSVIRTAMAVREGDNPGWVGYMVDDEREFQLGIVKDVIEAAINRGIYVIIDWHGYDNWEFDQRPSDHVEEAVEFFSYMAREYGQYENVIFEPLNEPIGPEYSEGYWEEHVKPYHEEVIAAIREYSDNLVIAGTPVWCQRVDVAAHNPIDDPNVAYSLHFYAGTHGDWHRDVAREALNEGVALFVSEWGTTAACGGRFEPGIFPEETALWMEFMDEHHLSWCAWSLSNIDEYSAALLPHATPDGNWSDSDLNESGRLLRDYLREYGAQDNYGGENGATFTISERVMARDYTDMSGVQIEDGQNIGWIDDGDWVEYNDLTLQHEGDYSITISAATQTEGGTIRILLNDSEIGNVDVNNTDGWHNWEEHTIEDVFIDSGHHTLRLEFSGTGDGDGSGLYNVNWINFETTIEIATSIGSQRRVSSSPTRSVGVSPIPNGIRLNISNPERFTEYSLFRINGRAVKSDLLNGKNQITINNLSKGAYIIRLNGNRYSEVFSAIVH